MKRFLGIDGGGTKTTFILIGSNGSVLASAQRPSIDYYRLGVQTVTQTVTDGVADVCGQTGISAYEIDFTVVGMPGYGEVSADVPILESVPRAALRHDRFKCVNDMVCGWAGSLGATDGINVVGGTGSITYGERGGLSARVGGWGEVFGDEGSGYWIAARGLNLFTRMSDGRLPRGPLYDLIKKRIGLQWDLDVIGVVLTEWQKGRTQIAALASTVAEAGTAGDSAALTILDDAGAELADLVDATRRELGFSEGEVVPVSYSGGVFRSETVLASFERSLSGMCQGYDLRVPRFEPGLGAALYAARMSGNPLHQCALGRLRNS